MITKQYNTDAIVWCTQLLRVCRLMSGDHTDVVSNSYATYYSVRSSLRKPGKYLCIHLVDRLFYPHRGKHFLVVPSKHCKNFDNCSNNPSKVIWQQGLKFTCHRSIQFYMDVKQQQFYMDVKQQLIGRSLSSVSYWTSELVINTIKLDAKLRFLSLKYYNVQNKIYNAI